MKAAIAAILDFRPERFYLFLIYKSLWCFLPSFKSVDLLVQEKKRKKDFQDGSRGGHFGFQIGTMFAIFFFFFFIFKSPQCFLPSLNWPFVTGEAKIVIQDGPLGFPIGTILAGFDLQVNPMLPTDFQVSWPFSSGVEAKNRFSIWWPRRPSWISGTILACFDFQVTPLLPTKFQVNWPFGSGEAKYRFSRWPQWRPFWISGRSVFIYFWSTSHSDASYQVSSQLVFWFRRRSEKYEGCSKWIAYFYLETSNFKLA